MTKCQEVLEKEVELQHTFGIRAAKGVDKADVR